MGLTTKLRNARRSKRDADLRCARLAEDNARLQDAVDLLRRTYEMLRDSTPGPLTDDMPVRPLLREARAFLERFDGEGDDDA